MMNNSPLQNFSHIPNGFSLVEILVSILVTAVGLLGIATLQTVSIRQNYGSNLLSQATFQSQNMIERMRANMAGVNQGAYDNITGSENDPNCSPNCSAQQWSLVDADNWMTSTKSVLNDAGNNTVTGTVIRNNDTTFTISISWQEPALPGQVDAQGDPVMVVTNSHVIRFMP